MARGRSRGMGQRPMRRLGLSVVLAVALGLLLMQTAPGIRDWFNPVRTVASDQIVSGTKPGFLSRITGSSAKAQRIAELEREVRDLERWRAAAISMAERLETYEEILNVMGEPPKRGVTARIAAETDGPFAETYLADVGVRNGIQKSWIAVNEGGLVGRVTRIGERSSRILLVTDFNSRVPIMGERSGMRGIIYGGRDGLGVITDVPERNEFVSGERILTSGEGGVFPRGLIAGYAVQRGEDWRVKFAMSDSRGGYVRLIPKLEIPKPEDNPVEPDPGTVAEASSNPDMAGQ